MRDTAITDVERLHYLKTSLKGEAELLVRHLTTTGENFQRAWLILSEHYANKRLLVRSHLATLTALPKMKGKSALKMRTVFHGLTTTVSALESIERPISDCSDLLVHLMIELLDARSRREWENSISGTSEPPSYETLRKFLECRLKTLETLNPPKADKGTPGVGSGAGRSARALQTQTREADHGKCVLCKKRHFVLFCPSYNQMDAQKRKEMVANRHICENCLGRHAVKECKSKKTCAACGKQHHSSLHDAYTPAGNANTAVSVVTNAARQMKTRGIGAILATVRVQVIDSGCCMGLGRWSILGPRCPLFPRRWLSDCDCNIARP